MIDVNIQEIIKVLNKKRYITNGCCESHFDGNRNMYVSFIRKYDINCPDGFKMPSDRMSINYTFKKNELKNKEKYEKIKSEKIKLLLEWAESLPENSIK